MCVCVCVCVCVWLCLHMKGGSHAPHHHITAHHDTLPGQIVGALSLPTMMLQVPGSFVFAYSLYLVPGSHWSSWVTFLVSGLLQGVLLALCLVVMG